MSSQATGEDRETENTGGQSPRKGKATVEGKQRSSSSNHEEQGEGEERGRKRSKSARARPPRRRNITTHIQGRRGSIPEDPENRISLKASRTFRTGRARTEGDTEHHYRK